MDKKKRYPKGTRRNKEGACVSKNESAKKTTRKRCPKGTRKDKEGNCVRKTTSSPRKSKTKTPPKSKTKTPPKSTKYIITIHNSNGTQIKDMDFSIDDPLEFISKVEKQSGVSDIIPMNDSYIKTYATLMHKSMEDVDGEEQASVWFVDTDQNVKPSYDVNYDGKSYIVKFHNV